MKIKKFGEKSIAVYHGLGGSPAQDRIDVLKSLGYTHILYDHIDFQKEWELDRCKSLMIRQVNRAKDVDLLMGFSLGGYIAFELAGYISKNLILINPAIDRTKTKLDIKKLDFVEGKNFKNIEIFLGDSDKLIDKNITIDFINRENIPAKIEIIKGMEHRVPINYFQEILNKSKLI